MQGQKSANGRFSCVVPSINSNQKTSPCAQGLIHLGQKGLVLFGYVGQSHLGHQLGSASSHLAYLISSQASQVSLGRHSRQFSTLPIPNPKSAPAFPKWSIAFRGINRHSGWGPGLNRDKSTHKKKILVFALGVFRPKPFCFCGVAGVPTPFTIPHLQTN